MFLAVDASRARAVRQRQAPDAVRSERSPSLHVMRTCRSNAKSEAGSNFPPVAPRDRTSTVSTSKMGRRGELSVSSPGHFQAAERPLWRHQIESPRERL